MSCTSGINRNIVECKEITDAAKIIWKFVLIETSWNVKNPAGNRVGDCAVVLIETSWNVKFRRIQLSIDPWGY